jgi:gamma-D-glutamyl-L-lysine dipeptidyl-peptidase
VNARIRVATATLFREPTTDRPADACALAEITDVRSWVAGLDDAERMRPAVVTQALLDEPAIVLEERDGWSRVVLTEQPADDLDPRGYPGWLPSHQLAPADSGIDPDFAPDAVDHIVAVTATTIRDAPDGDLVLPFVVLGTRLREVEFPARRRRVTDAWRAVGVPGRKEAVFARAMDLAAAATPTATGRDVLKTATMLREVRYVWGGLSPFGIDCSGLVHLSWRRHGVTLPRDAYNQAAATKPVPFGEERPGDLYFFAQPGQRIHHVGLVAARPRGETRVMLHADSSSGRVAIEEVRGERFKTLISAHRVVL